VQKIHNYVGPGISVKLFEMKKRALSKTLGRVKKNINLLEVINSLNGPARRTFNYDYIAKSL